MHSENYIILHESVMNHDCLSIHTCTKRSSALLFQNSDLTFLLSQSDKKIHNKN